MGTICVNWILEIVARLTGATRSHHTPPREGDVQKTKADVSLARQLLGYEPKVGIEEGLRAVGCVVKGRRRGDSGLIGPATFSASVPVFANPASRSTVKAVLAAANTHHRRREALGQAEQGVLALSTIKVSSAGTWPISKAAMTSAKASERW